MSIFFNCKIKQCLYCQRKNVNIYPFRTFVGLISEWIPTFSGFGADLKTFNCFCQNIATGYQVTDKIIENEMFPTFESSYSLLKTKE